MNVWWLWISGRLYRVFLDEETIRYEGNGPFIVKGKDTKDIANNQQGY